MRWVSESAMDEGLMRMLGEYREGWVVHYDL